MKKVKIFQLKIVIFAAVKYRCILHGRVFVMRYNRTPNNFAVNMKNGMIEFKKYISLLSLSSVNISIKSNFWDTGEQYSPR